jgi:hypothetical protein
MGCEICVNRPYCKELCPDAEVYANQDYVPSRDLTLSNDILDTMPSTIIDTENSSVKRSSKTVTLSYREWQAVIILILTNRSNLVFKLRKYLGVSRTNAGTILDRVRKKVGI